MSDSLPVCPKCSSEYTYEMDALMICPECGNEWVPAEDATNAGTSGKRVIKDAVGNVLGP